MIFLIVLLSGVLCYNICIFLLSVTGMKYDLYEMENYHTGVGDSRSR
jgi:hypothetical protein